MLCDMLVAGITSNIIQARLLELNNDKAGQHWQMLLRSQQDIHKTFILVVYPNKIITHCQPLLLPEILKHQFLNTQKVASFVDVVGTQGQIAQLKAKSVGIVGKQSIGLRSVSQKQWQQL